MLFPFLCPIVCRLLCVLATAVVAIADNEMDKSGAEGEMLFGERKPDNYDPLVTLIQVLFTWVSAPVQFGLGCIFGEIMISR